MLTACGANDSPAPSATQPDPAVEDGASKNGAPESPTSTPVPTAAPAPTAVPGPTATPLPPPVPVIYDDDFGTSIAPIFASKCASCHNEGGPGAAHWQLETADDLVTTHEWVTGVVRTGVMPPWPASELSVAFHENRSLRADEIEAIASWSSAGAPLDVAESLAIEPPLGTVALEADIEVKPHEPYQGSTARADDYRCFIYELGVDEPTWMTGYEFVPDQTQIVHHAIGYLAPAAAIGDANRLSDQDELGGWQCYGGSGLGAGDEMFLGWAPGQRPTIYPAGSGLLIEPGDFMVLQIHYHFDTDAPLDESTVRIDWSDDENLDPIDLSQFLAPAEIPCSTVETGPLCDRRAALARAYSQYGLDGVLADRINQLCGVAVEDFADMTTGIATSECTIPVRDFGEIVSVFGHEHEIGKSFRMTLNPGRPDEKILLDIPDWSFDWQYNYYPVESIMLEPGDNVLLECAWDRARRAADLEPAYVLWADGTNDEMCFATIATRRANTNQSKSGEGETTAGDFGIELDIPDSLARCMSDAGTPLDQLPARDAIDPTVDQLFVCADPAEIGELLAALIEANFGDLVGAEGISCLSAGLATPEAARSMLIFTLDDATVAERTPIGELAGDCVALSEVLSEFGFPLPESTHDCIDEVGRDVIVRAVIDGGVPDSQEVLTILGPCLTAS